MSVDEREVQVLTEEIKNYIDEHHHLYCVGSNTLARELLSTGKVHVDVPPTNVERWIALWSEFVGQNGMSSRYVDVRGFPEWIASRVTAPDVEAPND